MRISSAIFDNNEFNLKKIELDSALNLWVLSENGKLFSCNNGFSMSNLIKSIMKVKHADLTSLKIKDFEISKWNLEVTDEQFENESEEFSESGNVEFCFNLEIELPEQIVSHYLIAFSLKSSDLESIQNFMNFEIPRTMSSLSEKGFLVEKLDQPLVKMKFLQ